VAVGRGTHGLDALGIAVDIEQAVAAVLQLGLEDDDVGQVGAGDVPLQAVQDIAVAIPLCGRLDGVDVRARAFLGDGVTLVAFAIEDGLDVTLHLPRCRGLDQEGRGVVVTPADTIGDAADLLLHGDDLGGVETSTAVFLVDQRQPEAHLPGLLEMALADLVGNGAVVVLGVLLPGN